MQRDTEVKMETLQIPEGKLLIDREACPARKRRKNNTCVGCETGTLPKRGLPVGGREEKNFVGVERFPLHQEGDVRHVLVVQEVRI